MEDYLKRQKERFEKEKQEENTKQKQEGEEEKKSVSENENEKNNALMDFKLLISSNERSEKKFEDFWIEINPIFEMKVVHFQICSKLEIEKDKLRFTKRIELDKTPQQNNIENGAKLEVEIKLKGFEKEPISFTNNNSSNTTNNNKFDSNMLKNILSGINHNPSNQQHQPNFGNQLDNFFHNNQNFSSMQSNQDQLEKALMLSKIEQEDDVNFCYEMFFFFF